MRQFVVVRVDPGTHPRLTELDLRVYNSRAEVANRAFDLTRNYLAGTYEARELCP